MLVQVDSGTILAMLSVRVVLPLLRLGVHGSQGILVALAALMCETDFVAHLLRVSLLNAAPLGVRLRVPVETGVWLHDQQFRS